MFGSLCPTILPNAEVQNILIEQQVTPDKCSAWPPPHWWQMLLHHSALDNIWIFFAHQDLNANHYKFFLNWIPTKLTNDMWTLQHCASASICFDIIFVCDQSIEQNKIKLKSSKQVSACGFGPQLEGCWTNVPTIGAPLASNGNRIK